MVVGAGLGGLAAAMRLGAKGYRVTVLDRLDMPGGRASAITVNGHRFDLGPTIVTVPQVFRELWADCGRDFDTDVDLRPLDPFYEIRFPDGATFTARQDAERDARRGGAPFALRTSPAMTASCRTASGATTSATRIFGRRSMDSLKDLVNALPAFVRLRADRSVSRPRRAPRQGPAPALCAVVPPAVHRRRSVPRHRMYSLVSPS